MVSLLSSWLGMSSLSIFPIEILESITSVVTTSQQMRLWQCGRILNIKLKNGGLKRTSLCWSDCTGMPWPRSYFTTFDGIVDVEWGMDIGKSVCPTLELNLLPKTLKRLYLACEDVFILLRQQNVNMDAMLPLLESLSLSGCRLREENLKNLPSNLIELHVASFDDKIRLTNIFGDLPRHIARLTLEFNILDESELENDLPSQLISLKIYGLECNFNWFSKLPKSLKTIKIACRQLHRFYHEVTLPPQLEKLKLRFGPFPTSALPQLPQSLKNLEVWDIVGITANTELGSLLPKNLTRFACHQCSFDHSILENLPSSLTDLDATVSATHPDMLSFYSPDSVTINIRGGPFSEKLNLFPFPTKLQTLHLDHINDDICAMLPLGLKTLVLDEGLISVKGASKLPESLTSLDALFEIFDCNESWSYLRYISDITLHILGRRIGGKLNEHWISSLLPPSSSSTNSNGDGKSTNVNGFNQHVTSLRIYGGGNRSENTLLIGKPFFDALPKFINLKILDIDYIEYISSDWLCLIPNSVTVLGISSLNTSPTATQLSTLPQSLTHLSIGVKSKAGEQFEWKDTTLQSLPRSLQEFWSDPIRGLTQRMCEYLPPNLMRSSFFNMPGGFVPSWHQLYADEYGIVGQIEHPKSLRRGNRCQVQ